MTTKRKNCRWPSKPTLYVVTLLLFTLGIILIVLALFQDLPTFTSNLTRFIGDLRFYKLCNASLPAGSVSFVLWSWNKRYLVFYNFIQKLPIKRIKTMGKKGTLCSNVALLSKWHNRTCQTRVQKCYPNSTIATCQIRITTTFQKSSILASILTMGKNHLKTSNHK